MADIKKTIQEAQQILAELKTLADDGTQLTGNNKSDMEIRINHLMNVSEPEFNGNKLDIGLLDLMNNIDNQIKDKDDRVSQLTSEVSTKDSTIAEQLKQISDLTAKLGIPNQVPPKPQEEKPNDSSELSNLNNSVGGVDKIIKDVKAETEKLIKENQEIHQDLVKTKVLAYIGGTTSGMSLLGLIWLIFKDTLKAWFNRKVDKGISEIHKKVKEGINKI